MTQLFIKEIEIVGAEGKSNSVLLTTLDTFKVGEYYVESYLLPDLPDIHFKCIEILPQPVFKMVKKEDIPEGITPIRFKCDWGD